MGQCEICGTFTNAIISYNGKQLCFDCLWKEIIEVLRADETRATETE